MLFKNKRRVIIFLSCLLLLLLYVTRNVSILIPFSLALIALFLFSYIDRAFHFNFPEVYYVYIFAIFVLGTIIGPGDPPFGLYYRDIFFDKVLHFLNPILMCAILFYTLDRLQISLKWKLIMTVGLVFGILGLWEIGEYLSDVWLGTLNQGVYVYDVVTQLKAQQLSDPITDTMRDLIFGLLGSITFVAYKITEFHFTKLTKTKKGMRS